MKKLKLKELLSETLTWKNRKFGDRLPTLADYQEAHDKKHGKKVNEAIEVEKIQDIEASIFDIIIEFRNNFQKSEWKKNRKINMYIKQLLKIEGLLGNEVQELE